MIRFATLLLIITTFLSTEAISAPVELRGSPASMERQFRVAVKAEVTFVRTFEEIDELVEAGELQRLLGNEHYDLREGLSSDAARPEVRLFVELLAEEYFTATGEKLVVTSLIRPTSAQPPNSHRLSIHPTGLALDLRISQKQASRQWIETRLLDMERQGLLDITRERFPPHYHIALFPEPYLAHLEETMGAEVLALALSGEEPEEEAVEEITEEIAEIEEPRWRRSVWTFIIGIFGFA